MSDEFEVVETQRMPDGTEYRAIIQRDPDPHEPYDDGGWPILKLEWIGYQGRWRAEAFNDQARPYVDKFNEATNRDGYKGGYSTETFERYLRIFHGNTLTHVYGQNDTRATDYTYFAFDTEEWRDRMGLAAPPLVSEDPLNEVRAWLEGDVYGVGVETRYNPDNDEDDDSYGWAEADGMCWGYYGTEYATGEARTMLENAVKAHKVVHRYPEHEKIARCQREIDAIMEFLETHTLQGHTAVRGGHQQMVFEHFGIDYDKIRAERELMVQRLQEAAKSE